MCVCIIHTTETSMVTGIRLVQAVKHIASMPLLKQTYTSDEIGWKMFLA